ncbi:MAG: type II toxin-antitoxin system RelE/ParE family toxin [Candidatus Omnitrophota bacterium]
MAYSIFFTHAAEGQFKKLKDAKLKERIASALEYISDEPFIGKPLQGEFKGNYSYRIGDYRIIYVFVKEKSALTIVRIEHRKDVYR